MNIHVFLLSPILALVVQRLPNLNAVFLQLPSPPLVYLLQVPCLPASLQPLHQESLASRGLQGGQGGPGGRQET